MEKVKMNYTEKDIEKMTTIECLSILEKLNVDSQDLRKLWLYGDERMTKAKLVSVLNEYGLYVK